MKKTLSILFSLLMLVTVVVAAYPAAAEAITQDKVLHSGVYGAKEGTMLEIPAGKTLTVTDGATLINTGNIDNQGTIVVEEGGRYVAMEDGMLQEQIGPEADSATDHCPVIAVHTGSVEVKKNEIHFPQDTAVRIVRSSNRPSNEVWTMGKDSEVKYLENIEVNVPITGPDEEKDPIQYARLIIGPGSKNNAINGVRGLNAYYWMKDLNGTGSKWLRFDGLKLLLFMDDKEMNELSAKGENPTNNSLLEWSIIYRRNAGQIEPELKPEEGKVYKNLKYTNSRENFNEYNLYIPNSVKKHKPATLILFTHGGSWTGGTKEDFDYGCARMARHGYIAATIDYRLFKAEKDAPASMDDILTDMKDCVNAIYDRLSKEGYDITSMATSGYSAGGHLALLYAYKCPNAAKIPVKATFSQVGPADFTPAAWAPGIFQYQSLFDMYIPTMVPNYDSMSEAEKKKALAEISPITYVNKNTVPTVMTYAEEDVIVGHEHGEELNKKLNEYGVDHTYISLKKSNHTSEMDSSSIQRFWDTAYQYGQKYMSPQN